MKPSTSTVRIISGQWRSRRLQFSHLPGLRPTQDRIRETLFNWLAPHLSGAHCLDLFAGTGALGFEALSRGAEFTCFVDNHSQAIADLHKNAELLKVNPQQLAIIQGDCLKSLPLLPQSPFHIIFLDPPFAKDLLTPCLDWLHQSSYWQAGTWVYIEREKSSAVRMPPNWQLYRQQQTRSLIYELWQIVELTPPLKKGD